MPHFLEFHLLGTLNGLGRVAWNRPRPFARLFLSLPVPVALCRDSTCPQHERLQARSELFLLGVPEHRNGGGNHEYDWLHRKRLHSGCWCAWGDRFCSWSKAYGAVRLLFPQHTHLRSLTTKTTELTFDRSCYWICWSVGTARTQNVLDSKSKFQVLRIAKS